MELGKLVKFMVGLTLTAWAVGVGIALYVGFSVLVLDKDFRGKGPVNSQRRARIRMR